MTDIDTIRERHRPNGESRSFEPPRCHLDNQPWPCDTRVVLDALDEHLSRCIKHDIEVKAERNAARADAERLAEALRHTLDCIWMFDRDCAECRSAREALRQHEEATK